MRKIVLHARVLGSLFSWQNLLNAVLWRAIWSIALGATVRSAVKWLFRYTLERRQEIAFWLTVPGALFLTLLAVGYSSPTYQMELFGQQINEIQSTLNKMQQAQLPRHLTKQQVEDLGKALASFRGQPIIAWCPIGDQEACSFLDDFLTAFNAAGINGNASQSTFLADGIGILVPDPAHPPPIALTLSSVLTASQISTEIAKKHVRFVSPD